MIATAASVDRFSALLPEERRVLCYALTFSLARPRSGPKPRQREPGQIADDDRGVAWRLNLELSGLQHDPAALVRGLEAGKRRPGGPHFR